MAFEYDVYEVCYPTYLLYQTDGGQPSTAEQQKYLESPTKHELRLHSSPMEIPETC